MNQINGYQIIKEKKCIIVAELGINHNGSYDILIELTDAAFNNGADFVKLQVRTPRLCVPTKEWEKPREWFDGEMITYIEYKERMEFSIQDLLKYDKYVIEKYGSNRWFVSPWDHESVIKIATFDIPFIKIPSPKNLDKDLCKSVFQYTNPDTGIILSTGMSTKDEIYQSLNMYCDNMDSDRNMYVLHCNSSYPTIDSEVNLNGINNLKHMLENWMRIGFSSHNKSPMPIIYSYFFGAKMVEFHLTLDRSMKGTDHPASIEPKGLSLISREINRIDTLLGDGFIGLYESELKARKKLRG